MRFAPWFALVTVAAWACGEASDQGPAPSPAADAGALDGALSSPDAAQAAVDAAAEAQSTPSLAITSAPPAQQDDSIDATFVFTAMGIPNLECRLDGAAFTPCTSPITYPALAKGVHTFDVRAAGGTLSLAASHRWIVFAPLARKWFAPMPFVTGRTVRPDFAALPTTLGTWANVRASADVFKSYLMILPDDSGVDLDAMVTAVNEAGLRTAFEVGGLRVYAPGNCAVGVLGKTSADVELLWLQRWAAAAGGTGRIDYVTSDHAIATVIEQGLLGNCNLTLAQSAAEVAVYYKRIKQAYPKVKIGLIEALGYWNIPGANGTHYKKTRPDLPDITLDAVLTAVIAAAAAEGVTVEHFDIDFGAEGARIDYSLLLSHGGTGTVVNAHDYGRVVAARQIAVQKGLTSGVITNAYHDDGTGAFYPTINTYATEPERIAASQSARARALEFFNEHKTVGGAQNKYVFQLWQPFPHLTGPESTATTGLGVIEDLLALTP